MPSHFESFEPYAVPDLDSITVGRLRHAAKHGDRRAALTLKPIDAQAAAEKAARRAEVTPLSVERGRELYRSRHEVTGAD